MTTAQEIQSALEKTFQPTQLQINDDSALHAGHAGAKEGGHFTVFIVAERFRDVKPIDRHRLIYEALKDLRPKIHALAIKAFSPEER